MYPVRYWSRVLRFRTLIMERLGTLALVSKPSPYLELIFVVDLEKSRQHVGVIQRLGLYVFEKGSSEIISSVLSKISRTAFRVRFNFYRVYCTFGRSRWAKRREMQVEGCA